MKAAVMEGFRQPLVVKNVPDPTVGPAGRQPEAGSGSTYTHPEALEKSRGG
jgi:hypothetical protein